MLQLSFNFLNEELLNTIKKKGNRARVEGAIRYTIINGQFCVREPNEMKKRRRHHHERKNTKQNNPDAMDQRRLGDPHRQKKRCQYQGQESYNAKGFGKPKEAVPNPAKNMHSFDNNEDHLIF